MLIPAGGGFRLEDVTKSASDKGETLERFPDTVRLEKVENV